MNTLKLRAVIAAFLLFFQPLIPAQSAPDSSAAPEIPTGPCDGSEVAITLRYAAWPDDLDHKRVMGVARLRSIVASAIESSGARIVDPGTSGATLVSPATLAASLRQTGSTWSVTMTLQMAESTGNSAPTHRFGPAAGRGATPQEAAERAIYAMIRDDRAAIEEAARKYAEALCSESATTYRYESGDLSIVVTFPENERPEGLDALVEDFRRQWEDTEEGPANTQVGENQPDPAKEFHQAVVVLNGWEEIMRAIQKEYGSIEVAPVSEIE